MRHPLVSRIPEFHRLFPGRKVDVAQVASITPCRAAAWLAAAALVLLLSASVRAQAQSDDGNPRVAVARLSDVNGSVQILPMGESALERALVNMPVVEGSRLQTGEDGRAEVQLPGGNLVRLAPNSSLRLSQLRGGPDGAGWQVEILSGLAYVEWKSAPGQSGVRFGPNTVTASSGAVVRIDLDSTPVSMSVFDGSAQVAGGPYNVDVRSGETIRFDTDDPARYYLTQEIKSDSWDDWNRDRDQALAQQAQQQTEVADAERAGNDPGWSDLDASGSWYSIPGYGNVWTPYGAGPGWDPYGYGYWGYYPGLGYSWISGYSWGWIPYRCGAWNYFSNFGWWGWMPGGCGGFGFGGGYGWPGWYYWNPVVIVQNAPPGYRLPPRPVPSRAVPLSSHIIPVDRGVQARQIRPLPAVRSPRPIVIGNQRIDPLPPKTGWRGGQGSRVPPGTARPAPGVASPGAPAPGRVSPGTPRPENRPPAPPASTAPRVQAPPPMPRSAPPPQAAPMPRSAPPAPPPPAPRQNFAPPAPVYRMSAPPAQPHFSPPPMSAPSVQVGGPPAGVGRR